MAFTETRTVGYGSRVGNSLSGIGIGILLFLGGTALLWWNEGRAVKTNEMLIEAEGVTEELESIDRIDPEMEGQLVYASGLATTEDSLVDEQFGVGAKAIKLLREVEYFQVREEKREESEDKFGGKEEITTTYSYSEGWTDSPIQSSQFHDPTYQKRNFVLTKADNQDLQAETVKFGAFKLNKSQVNGIIGEIPVDLSIDSIKLTAWNKECQQSIQRQFGGKSDSMKLVHVTDNVIYYGFNPSNPSVGDVRITFTKIMPKKVSIIAKQTGSTFGKFKAKNGKKFSTIRMGEIPVDEIYEDEHTDNTTLLWALRLFGTILVIIGLKGIFNILETILKVVPFVANIVGWGVGMICAIIGIVWALLIIAIAWLFYRPILAIAIMAVAAFIIWVFAFKGKDKLKDLASKYAQPGPQQGPQAPQFTQNPENK